MKKTVIIDFQSGNLFSVFHACRLLGLDPVISSDPSDIRNAGGVILPGVGAFGDAMKQLNAGITEPLKEYIKEGKPFMGICLGMQLLFEESEEFGAYKGLGLVKGVVKKFSFESATVKIPNVGWNHLIKPPGKEWNNTLLRNVSPADYMYFVHSYYVQPAHAEDAIALTDYEGMVFCSAIMKNNIFATQFHPEKSGNAGMSILKEFAALINGRE